MPNTTDSSSISSSTSSSNSSSNNSTSRFSLILLEPGEIYFEDYLVYYYELNCPFDENMQHSANLLHKGNLKVCSKSLVFDPLNFSYPLVKFPYKSIEKIHVFSGDVDAQKNYFGLSCNQTILCKMNNKISPYKVNKANEKNAIHYFKFIFTNTDDSLDLFSQLHRASTLDDYEQEELMLELILNSRLQRDLKKFDLLIHQLDDVSKEQIQYESLVKKIEPLVANPGKILLTQMCLYYKPFNNLNDDIKIRLNKIKYVIKRRYHLKKIGCEILFDSSGDNFKSTSKNHAKSLPYLYLTFESEESRDLFYSKLVNEKRDKLTSLEDFNQENMLQKWRYGLISNFDYLIYLNNMADRSYKDLTQYPVFPWILNDYSADSLDLNDHRIFRDLSKPVGALNEDRLSRLRQRCREMQSAIAQLSADSNNASEPSQQVFLYGTHYSTPAFVSYYLLRQYPEWQLCLQNGRFDHPNRLFHSIQDTWKNCMQLDSDVKELIPEFYDTNNADESQLGAFLRNYLELDLGIRQDGLRVNHVLLPKWANNSPREFILKMREALESSLVSEHLHKWIDLIFGYKQRGQEALQADNLYYYLCYEGAIDLNSIKNFVERKSLEIQIQEFGQIPTQLFKSPHLQRVKLSEMIEPSLTQSLEQAIQDLGLDSQARVKQRSESASKRSSCFQNFKDIKLNLSIKLHKSQINDCAFLPLCKNDDEKLPLICTVSNDQCLKMYSLDDRSIFRSYKVANFSVSSIDFIEIDDDNDGESEQQDSSKNVLILLSCWDNSIYLYDMNFNRCIHELNGLHDDAISRIRVLKSNANKLTYFLTNSWDSLTKLWCMNTQTYKCKCLSELCHDAACIDFFVSDDESHLGTICKDGNLNVWRIELKNLAISEHANEEEDSEWTDEASCASFFQYLFSVQNASNIGSINDCSIITSEQNDQEETSFLALCTSHGYVKIFNIKTQLEIFSLNIQTELAVGTQINLNKLAYTLDYIISIDSNGSIYFIDLKQQNGSFLSHHIKLNETSSLKSLSIYGNSLISVGDMEGNLYLLSSKNF